MQGIVFDIKRFAVHDGPGLRTTIFFKGCPLACWWCHNPESISSEILQCEKILKLGSKKFRETENIGRRYTVNQLLNEIEKDTVFYEESAGGVTLSGGEPLLQAEFIIELTRACKEREIHVCIDTSGYFNSDILPKMIPLVDLFLYDIKLIDDTQHKKYTGVSNRRIIDNFELLLKEKQPLIVRYPLIPGINDFDEHLNGLQGLLRNRVEEIHFLPYHLIPGGKWKRLGLKNRMNGIKELPGEEVEKIRARFIYLGYKVKIGG